MVNCGLCEVCLDGGSKLQYVSNILHLPHHHPSTSSSSTFCSLSSYPFCAHCFAFSFLGWLPILHFPPCSLPFWRSRQKESSAIYLSLSPSPSLPFNRNIQTHGCSFFFFGFWLEMLAFFAICAQTSFLLPLEKWSDRPSDRAQREGGEAAFFFGPNSTPWFTKEQRVRVVERNQRAELLFVVNVFVEWRELFA